MTPPATATSDQDRRRCDREECSEIYPGGSGHAGYCTDTCWSQAEAARLINIVQSDHRFCASCFRRLRDVVPPGRAPHSSDKHKDIPECAIGYAYPTPETLPVTGEVLTLEATAEGLAVVPTEEHTRRQGCDCGVTHHATVERRTLPTGEAIQYADRLTTAVIELADDGVHQREVVRDIVLDAVRYCKTDPDNQADGDTEVFRKGLAAGLLAAIRS